MKIPIWITIAVLFFAAPTVTVQPQPQTVQVGQTATFTANASLGGCRTTILKNGALLKYGPVTGMDGTVSYTTPVLTLADNGEKFSFEFYGCGGSVLTQQALLTVVPVHTVTLAVAGNFQFDDGSPVMPNTTASVLEWEGADASGNPIWTPIGTVTNDSVGHLAGTVTVDWSFTAGGLVGLSLSLGSVPMPGTEWIDPRSLQHGSTGISLSLVLWKSDLTAKSGALSLIP
jgi:hypothetical protein